MSPIVLILIGLALLVPAIAVAVPVHEMGHAAAAYLLGDRSVRYFRYFSIDPRRYLEPVGTLAIFLGLVGWGRRVPIQSNRINTTAKKVLYELGGPAANLLVALVVGQVVRVMLQSGFHMSFDAAPQLLLLGVVYVIVFLNLSLFAFNLLPVPGLDGWNVLDALFRRRNARFFFNVAMRQREIWVGAVIAIVAFQFLLGISLLSIVMTPFFEPASLISLNACVGYRIPNLAFLLPCLL